MRKLLVIIAILLMVSTASATVATFYTTGTEDGRITRNAWCNSWNDITRGAGTELVTDGNSEIIRKTTCSDTDTWLYNDKIYYEFNTSTLPDTATISSAKFSVYTGLMYMTLGSEGVGITGFTPTTNGTAETVDFNNFTSVRYSTDLTDPSAVTRYNFTINAAGLANISKIGYTNMMLRMTSDIDNVGTQWSEPISNYTAMYFFTSEKEDISLRPFLEVTYTDVVVPVAAFSADDTTPATDQLVTFTDASTNTPTDWDWYFWANETKSSDDQSPTYTFPTGTYSIRLYAANSAGGDWENKTNYITSGAIPLAMFTKSASLISRPKSVTFNDTSTYTPTSWSWGFGDGSTNATTQNASHVYTRPGIFTVGITATNALGSNYNSTTIRVIIGGQQFNPKDSEYVSCEDYTYSVSRELNSYEMAETEAKIFEVCYPWNRGFDSPGNIPETGRS